LATVDDVSDEPIDDVASLNQQLMKAYLAGDGAAVVRCMELIQAAEQARTPVAQAQQKAA
jgi:hypothetical protein